MTPNKHEFIGSLKGFKSQLAKLESAVSKVPGKQIQSKAVLKQIEEAATFWFDQIEAPLRKFTSISEATIDHYHHSFGRLIEASSGKPYKERTADLIETIETGLTTEILVAIQKHVPQISDQEDYSDFLTGLQGLELEYMKEAVACASGGWLRAAVVLGWCAAVDRLHRVIERVGFDKFNKASSQMSKISSGRYKRFNKVFDIHNLAELRMSVFDNDLLWVMEFLALIDGNQHEKLEICFTTRNICAHPGDADVSPENTKSFFSDLQKLVFSNSKFKIS